MYASPISPKVVDFRKKLTEVPHYLGLTCSAVAQRCVESELHQTSNSFSFSSTLAHFSS